MKKIIIVATTVLIISVQNFSQIQSTSIGGYWNVPATWIGNTVPGAGDDVIINGPVIHASAIGYDILTEYCNNLTITSTGSLRNGDYGGGSGVYPLVVLGNVVNNGIVENSPSDALKIFVNGDLENNNIWMPYETELQNSLNHNLSVASGKSFGSRIINSSETLTALTDLNFTCDWFYDGNPHRDNLYLNGHTLALGNHSIKLHQDCVINKGKLQGDFEIRGTFRVGWADGYDIKDTLVFEGNITVTDTLAGNIYGGGYGIYKIKVVGNITNNGVIKDDYDQDKQLNPDDLNILITGNIINHGIWENNFISLVGNTNQYITQDIDKKFDCYFTSLKPGGNIIANSNLTITKDFNLNGNILDMQDNKLTISGWLYNGTIANTILHNGFVQNINSLNNLRITGSVTVDDGNVFQNTVTIEDTLQSNEYGGGSKYFILPIYGDIINHGLIKNINDGDMLSLEIHGNLINTGRWENSITKFVGCTEYHITSIDKVLNGDFFVVDTTGIAIANSDLTFSGNWNIGGAVLEMQNNNLMLNSNKWISNGKLKNTKLHNGNLSSLSLLGEIEINGLVQIENNVDAIANIVINDTLTTIPYDGGAGTFYFTNFGNIENRGLLGQAYDDVLKVTLSGNIINSGTWNAVENNLLFYPNQNILSISCFNPSTSNWFFNSSIINGSGAAAFSIVAGGGTQTISPDQSYDLSLQFNPTGGDTIAVLNIDCIEIGSLNNINLVGHTYNTTVGVEDHSIQSFPKEFILFQNYPNPFNPSTSIQYVIGSRQFVQLKVYDVLGNEIATLVNEEKSAGSYEVEFNTDFSIKNPASGVYFYQLKTYEFVETKKMILIK
jgi:hypothetical protein